MTMNTTTFPEDEKQPTADAEHQDAGAIAPLLAELNRAYPDGAAGVSDPKASSQGFLRRAAFARESMIRPNDHSKD